MAEDDRQEDAMESLFVFAILIGNLALYFVAQWGFDWALKPLDRADTGRKCAWQCSLADILCLFVPAQLALGAVHWAMQDVATGMKEWVWDMLIVVFMPLIWWRLVLKLSRANIHVVRQRCVVLMVAPLVVFVGLSISMCGPPFGPYYLADKHLGLTLLALLVVLALLGTAIYGLRRFTQAIVGPETLREDAGDTNSRADTAEQDPGSMKRYFRYRPWKSRRD
jgi:hypothetical protein